MSLTPDKDPVPKSIASIDKAADSTKPSKKRKGDKTRKMHLKSYLWNHDEESENDEEIVVEDMTKMEAH